MTRLREQYTSEIVPALQERFKYGNTMQVPRLEKIVVNAGVGEAVQESKALDAVLAELTAITGQKPAVRRAKKAISNFKLREGMPIGAMVTLRREHMFEFLDRFVNFALPQSRDFRGVPATGFDGRGNYNLGIREQIIFPEIDYDRVNQIRGMNITFVTSATNDEEAKELLRLLGVPFSN
ncbi:MAG TPA: 50S ribosomal protein L5 [Candidatus Latescibacteria bacterium]|jgi:large subunit ribosomal protein L5|nr:50S ribosomal protein L5 [Gemmatimonadaceae bacterium]HJP30340.1 50S ribosomal protein L5 [Candidatus Latescibacterota bacterium]